MKYDFKGYATKVNIRCSDGRTILKDAFKDNDGATVPLVWQHMHNDPSNILGHAILENRSDGVYAYCKFNDTPSGKNAKALVKHGDITALSIYANSLVQKGKDVIHGMIREVSLVLTGANPGAMIDNVAIEHADGSIDTSEDEAIIYSGLDFELDEEPKAKTETKPDLDSLKSKLDDKLEHSSKSEEDDKMKKTDDAELFAKFKEYMKHAEEDDEDEGKSVKDVFDTMNDDQKTFVMTYLAREQYGDEIFEGADSDEDDDEDSPTLEDVYDSMNDEQKACLYILAENIDQFKEVFEDAVAQSGIDNTNDGGYDNMKKNVFDDSMDDNTIQHSAEELKGIIEDAKRLGSMREACLAHSITNIEILFPDAVNVTPTPEVIKRDDAWIPTIMNNTRHTPFSRVKSYAFDITAEEARARGYVKGTKKVEEVISALKRITNPTTIYKTQKLDRDDLLDITDFDVVVFLKNEMRLMLNEEIARAILVGDGRLISASDKISEDCIRPIYKDVTPYVTRYTLEAGLPVMDLIDSIIRARKDYRGTGTPTLFATTDVITDMLLVKDTTGRRIYNTENELASGIRVGSIVDVPVMEGINRQENTDTLDLKAILVNPRDYTVGTNAGGQITFFDDFDIDYNQQKYLIETRVSGCLTRPQAAIVFEQVRA